MGTEAGIPELGVGSAGAAVYGEYEALLNQGRKRYGFAAVVLKISNLLVLALGMLSFGSGFYSLLSADDDLRGAVPIERVSASTLIASSFVICIVACAGYTSVVTHSNILLFLYFVFNLLVYTLVVGVTALVYFTRAEVIDMFKDWCDAHPDVRPCQPENRDAALAQIQDHLLSVGQAAFVMCIMMLCNLVATFVMMQQVHKPTIYGWTHEKENIFGGYDDDWHQDVRLDDAYAQQAFRAGGALGTLGEREEEDVERLQQAYSPRGGPVVGDTGYLAERLYHAGSDSD